MCDSRFFKSTGRYINICLEISSIHGFAYLAKNTISERLLWLAILITSLVGYIIIAYKTWDRYQVSPTVLTIELDYYNWNLSYPSFTLCLGLKDETITAFLNKNYKNLSAEEKNEYKNFFRVLYTPESYRGFSKIYDFDKLSEDAYLDTLLELTNDIKINVAITLKSDIKPTKYITEVGVCHAFNSEIAYYFTDSYWKKNRWDLVDLSNNTAKIKYTMFEGSLITLSNFNQEFTTFLHSYNEIMEWSSPKYLSDAKKILRLHTKLISLDSSEEVINLNPVQRKCRLTQESFLRHSPVYSYNLCVIECRIQLCLKYCECLPYFYRRLDGEKICNPSGMRCLGKYANKLEKPDNCNCVPECFSDSPQVEFFENKNWPFGSTLTLDITEFPKRRYKKELIFGIINVLISIGGTAGLFLGCGILSFVEIGYFLTLKLFWYIYNNRRTKTKPKRDNLNYIGFPETLKVKN